MNFTAADIRVMIRVVTRRTGEPVHDEDLVQEASLRAIEAFRNRTDIRHPRAFLMKVVENTVSDYWRRRRIVHEISALNSNRLIEAPAFEDDLDRRRQIRLLRHALTRLDAGKRATIDLFYVEDRPLAEIAKLQQKSISAVKMDLLRSRRRLERWVRALEKRSGSWR
jgi:RNA polymerase sigma-70 factor (ECF subfamily)